MQQFKIPDSSPLFDSARRAALSGAIEALGRARDRLAEAEQPMGRLERLAARSAEAAELHNKVLRLRMADAEMFGLSSGDSAEGRFLPPELSENEERLARLADCAADAQRRLSEARANHVAAAEGVHRAAREREEALWPAVVEAASPEFHRLEDAVRGVLSIEARLRGLIIALREAGNRPEPGAGGALRAAEKLELRLKETRGTPEQRVDIEICRAWISRLRVDPDAIFLCASIGDASE